MLTLFFSTEQYPKEMIGVIASKSHKLKNVVNSFRCNCWIETKFNIPIIRLQWRTQEPKWYIYTMVKNKNKRNNNKLISIQETSYPQSKQISSARWDFFHKMRHLIEIFTHTQKINNWDFLNQQNGVYRISF